MIVEDVVMHLEALAPITYAEKFDNVGLLVGNKNSELTGVLVTLDTLEIVIDEAIEKNCNLIVSFHPIIFNGLKKITGSSYVERVVLKAIENKIAIYAIHTALDNAFVGTNAGLCEILGLQNKKVLIPQVSTIKQLTTYVPKENAESLRAALFEVGAGSIGNYNSCSFNVNGKGTFKGDENSSPVVGKKHVLQKEKEVQINISFEKHLEKSVLKTLFQNHPYEEAAYKIITLENTNQHIGIGMIGVLENPMSSLAFLKFIKKKINCNLVRHSRLLNTKIKKVAVLGGSGSFAIEAAKSSGAQAFITSDLKYHDFFKAENELLLIDIGHYESEQHIKNILVAYLNKKITNFAVVLSTINTNPVKYT
ncbi:MAG: Nif3-like dinuclear metal center hexameric protein [Formosa sp.]|jgi:dinuclear metal center YbgI/SA1388 family protein|nr:Nif3-like dinuclear metal center hexameric protein [Formosa sp.]MDB2426840.1 Nif3-like dinuclear metal center hexameric protein [Flavobacteriaceae bacterium]